MIYVENFESRSFIHFVYVWLFVCVLVSLNVVAILVEREKKGIEPQSSDVQINHSDDRKPNNMQL